MRKNYSRLYLFVLFCILLGSIFIYRVIETRNMDTINFYGNGELIKVTTEESFYDDTTVIELELSGAFPKETVIYYTLNGDDPTLDSEIYKDGIILKLEELTKVYPIKARGYYDGEFSETFEKTIVISQDVASRFNLPMISLTTDQHNLYDYESGIFVPGKTYDDYLANGGNPHIDQSSAPTNYTMRTDEWIRKAHITMFQPDGTIVFDQNIGISVTGGTSSGQEIKSLKLISGKEYDVNNDKFSYNLYYDSDDISDFSHQIKFNNLKMRNGGQDMFFTNMRWGIASQLAKDSNLSGTANSLLCVVYLNGAYYGIVDLMENYSSYNLAKRYGIREKDIINERVGASEKRAYPAIGLSDLLNKDLTQGENIEKLENLIDVDNFLQYYAFEIMINNIDWPHNNIKVWNTSTSEDGNPYTDGKYRFLLFDADLSFMNPEDYSWSASWPEVLERILGDSDVALENSALENMLKNYRYRNKMLTMLCDLMNTSFTKENLSNVIENEKALVASEIPYLASESNYSYKNNFVHNFEHLSDTLLNTALERTKRVKEFLHKKYDLDTTYKLQVETANAVVSWNYISIYDNFEGEYYNNVPFTISADVFPGYEFDYWSVNGVKYYDEDLTIDSAEMVEDGKIYIYLKTKKDNSATLIINEVYPKGGEDWIEIYNPTAKEISLTEYSLSDNKENLYKFSFDQGQIKPGEVITVNCKNNYELNEFIANFNLNAGETLYLSRNEEVVDKLLIPESNGIESYGRYMQGTKYKYFMKSTKGELNN